MLASGYVRKTNPGVCIFTQYVHDSVPGGGELTWVILYVVDLESRGMCDRCVDFPVALTLLVEGPYGNFDVVIKDV